MDVTGNQVATYIVSGIFSLMVYLITRLIRKLDDGNRMLINLDKQMAIIMIKLDSYNSRITDLEIKFNKLSDDFGSMKLKISEMEFEK